MNRSRVAVLVALAALFALPATAVAGHNLKMTLDHAGQPIQLEAPPSNAFTSGGPGAKWELLRTFPTGNPHTDVDFFTQGANTFVSAGTLGIGPNQGGQEIFQLTDGGKVAPKPVSSHGSASCLSNAADATGLQHDVEATPKGNAILNADVTSASREDTQLLLDATDAPGRCHDQGVFGVEGVPQGGLEIIDVTDIKNPVEIGFTSHIGEAHTVNVDPRRPHIAYASTSDSIGVNPAGVRNNETGSSLNLDGFEMVDLSSCMNFPAGTTVAGQARPLPATGLPLPLSVDRHGAGAHQQEQRLRLPRAGGLPGRQADVRRRQRADRHGHERCVRQPRHARQPARRQAARHAAAVHGAGQLVGAAVRHRREDRGLRGRARGDHHRPGRAGLEGPGLAVADRRALDRQRVPSGP